MLRARLKVDPLWLSTGRQPGFGAGVYYSSQGVAIRSAFNEVLTMEDDGRQMLFRATIGDRRDAGPTQRHVQADCRAVGPVRRP